MANNFYKDKAGRYPLKTVTLESVDGAVFDYFDKKISITVQKKGSEGQLEPYKVPVVFAAHERWAQIRKNNFRDKHGTLILPIISIRRTDITRNTDLGGHTSAQKTLVISQKIHPKTQNIQNQVEARRNRGLVYQPPKPPVMEILTMPAPDFCTVNYEITVWSDFNTHMNSILEKKFYRYENVGGRVDSIVMPLEYDGDKPKGDSFYFVGFPQDMTKQSNDDDITDQERIVKYEYEMQVSAYLILDPDDEALSYGEDAEGDKIVYKRQSANQVRWKEKILTLEQFEKIYG